MEKKSKIIRITRKTTKADIESLEKGCVMCGRCCQFGSGALIGDDFENIAGHLKISVDDLKKKYLREHMRYNTRVFRPKIRENDKGFGPCIFLGEDNKCTIHKVKPFECRISTCGKDGADIIEWFNLNYIVNPNDPKSDREWAIKLKIHPTISGGELHEIVHDKEWLKKVLDMKIL